MTPQTYFADAWYFVALLEPRDHHHRNAVRLQRQIGALVTHEAVLSEVLSYFAEEGARARSLAAQTVRITLATSEVHSAHGTLFTRALDLYEARPDKEYSLVDCMSMVVMRDRAITQILTNDHHFRQEGFTVVSE